MSDVEKVIKGLECCSRVRWKCPTVECPYYGEWGCSLQVKKDAFELLKEQNPVEPRKVKRYIQYNNTAVDFSDTYNCGNCGKELPDNAKYCSACGRAVKWDE